MSPNSIKLKNFKDFEMNGIVFDGTPTFCKTNLLIGRNGSGKTRFLKSLEKYYKVNTSKCDVVTLYFPEIKSKSDINANSSEDLSISLYDAIFEGISISFKDFLKLAEKNCISLIQDIYQIMNMRAVNPRARMRDGLEKLNKLLNDTLDVELFKDEKKQQIYLVKYPRDNKNVRMLPFEETINEFSPGELMLFYLSLFVFYLSYLKSNKLILIIDEPELHLHPKALISLMEMLMDSSSINQLWVASHSLFIMPLFKFEQLVFFKQNHIKTLNRNTYKDIYDDLVGLQNADMYELLKSIDNWSYYQFIVESFFLPSVRELGKKDDEQLCKVLQCLRQRQLDSPIKVLDYGAGRFRLWECLKLRVPDSEERDRMIIYEAFEPYLEVKVPDNIKYYENSNQLRENRYPIVVLMNVLHEIDPFKWVETFKTIAKTLTKNGVLIFLEVFTLTNGEQPYGNSGFLLLQDPQVKKLFPNAVLVHNDTVINEKTNCWVIPKNDLTAVTFDDIVMAIELLERHCENQLEKIDNERINIAQEKNRKSDIYAIKNTARQYAFLAQQYINAHLAYKRLKKNKELERNVNAIIEGHIAKVFFPGIEKN